MPAARPAFAPAGLCGRSGRSCHTLAHPGYRYKYYDIVDLDIIDLQNRNVGLLDDTNTISRF